MLQKSSMLRVAERFFAEPTSPHCLAEISRSLKLAHTSVKKNLSTLTKLGLITMQKEKKGSRSFPAYKANLDSKEFRRQKLMHNLSSILQSGVAEHIEDKVMPKSIVLFGSYRRGEDTEDSDIDLFVEAKSAALDLSKYEKKIRRKIELHFSESMQSYPPELKNNLINGIVLSGFLEGYK